MLAAAVGLRKTLYITDIQPTCHKIPGCHFVKNTKIHPTSGEQALLLFAENYLKSNLYKLAFRMKRALAPKAEKSC